MNDAKQPERQTRANRATVIAMAVILLAGAFCAGWSARQRDRHMREKLLFQARQVAQTIDSGRILALSGTRADGTVFDYLRLKEQLACVRSVTTGCAFVYLMGRRPDGTVFFYADSEPVGSDDESPAGQIYEEISHEDQRVFDENIALATGPATDRWGTWISALVPLSDPASGALVAVVGLDFAAGDWHWDLMKAALPPILLAVAMSVLAILCSRLIERRTAITGQPISQQNYRKNLVAIIAMGSFLSLAAAWLVNEETARTRQSAFRHLAQDKAATLAKSLQALHYTELEALARLFEASEYVSPNEFIDYTDYLARNPAVETWAWAQWVPAIERNRFEAHIRAEGFADFTIWQRLADGQRTPAMNRSEYYPVVRATVAGSRSVLGFDLGSIPACRTALDAAVKSGMVTCSTTRHLHDPDQPPVIRIYRPVLSRDDASQARGVALADLRPDRLLKNAHPTATVLLELGRGAPEAKIERLAASWSADNDPLHRIRAQFPIFVFGETFWVTAHAGQAFLDLHPVYPAWLAAASGLILTILISGWFGAVHRKRERLELLVDDRTRDLRESESRLRTLIDTLPDLVWLKDPQGAYLFCNKRFERLYGAKEADIVGKTDYDFVDRKTADFFREKDRAAMTAGRACLNEEELQFAGDGHREIVETIKTPMVDARGNTTGVLGVARNITERKQAGERLRLSEEKFSKVFTMAPDVIAITRLADGLITDVNLGFETITGWKKSEAIGRTSIDIQFWIGPAIRSGIVAELKAGREIRHRDIRFRRKDGSIRNGVYSARVIGIANEQYIISVIQDVTDNRAMQADRRKLEAQLQQSQKLEAVGILAGGVAHDFNNMLGAIIGYAEMAMMELGSGDPIRKNFNKILDAAQRSASLTRQLLAFARKQNVEPVVLDLNAAIEETLKMLRRLIGENIELAWLPATGTCSVRMDPSQLDQILANLCVNARDAITDVGKINIQTGTATFDEKTSSAYADCVPGSYVRLSISDDGCGMDRELQNRVFEPFFTTKEMGRGTGLGLATVYGIVKQNNGFIQLFSEPGTGTTVTIYLPRHAADAAAETSQAKDAIPRSRGETVLMVEDDATMREMGQLMLQRLGYTVLLAATPGEAIRTLEEKGADIRLFITDVVMPEMNGRELADRLQAIRPGVKYLFMSGYTADIIAHQGVLDEGINFIQKPFTAKDLALKLRDILDQPSDGT